MKFGKTLLKSHIPEWSRSYISYKSLKKLLKNAVASQQQGTEPSEDSITAFFFALDRELERVNSFYLFKRGEIERQFRILADKYRQTHHVSTTPGVPSPTISPSDDPERDVAFLSALHETKDQINKLLWYAEMNKKGFVKILKKFDKRLQKESQTLYMNNKVNVLPFVSSLVPTEMLDNLEGWIKELSQRVIQQERNGSAINGVSRSTPNGQRVNLSEADDEVVQNALDSDDAKALGNVLDRIVESTNPVSPQNQKLLQSILLRSCQHKAYACIALLMDCDTNIIESDEINERSLLHKLAIHGSSGLLATSSRPSSLFFSHKSSSTLSLHRFSGAPVSSTSSLDLTHNLYESDDAALITFILKRITRSNAASRPDILGRCPLHYAAINGYSNIARTLLVHMIATGEFDKQRGFSDPKWYDHEGLNPMFYAVLKGHVKVVEALIEVGEIKNVDVMISPIEMVNIEPDIPSQGLSTPSANGSIVSQEYTQTPLAMACKLGHTDVVGVLVRHGAKVDLQDNEGETALHVAARGGFVGCVKLLVKSERGDQLNVETEVNKEIQEKVNGWTPLMIAAIEGHLEIVQILINAGSNVNTTDSAGWTAHEHSVFRGHANVAKLLKPLTAPYESPPNLFQSEPNAFNHQTGQDTVPAERAYGHRYLQGQSMIVITLGSNDVRCRTPFAHLNHNRHSVGSIVPSNVVSLVVSATHATGEPVTVDLPVGQDGGAVHHPESVVFLTTHLEEVLLRFDILPTYGSAKRQIVGRATALLASDQPFSRGGGNDKNDGVSLRGQMTVPIVGAESLESIGFVSFEYVVVNSFEHPNMSIGSKHTYWKSLTTQVIGHRGLGMNRPSFVGLQLGENTVLSFVTAASLGAEYVEFDVQLTKDLVPVIYHDWTVTETGFDIPMNVITLEQFLNLRLSGHTKEYHTGTSQLGPTTRATISDRTNDDLDSALVYSYESGTRSRPCRSNSLSALNKKQPQDTRTQFTKATKSGKMKGNGPWSIQAPFTTLEEAFKKVPSVGFNIEVKYPMIDEAEADDLPMSHIELNTFVDSILRCVYDHAVPQDRKVIFSSFHPEICLMLNFKQPNYPVFFLTDCGYFPMADVRCNSIQEAVRFAKAADLLGVVTASEPVLEAPRMVREIKETGLLLFTYGALNNDVANARLQRNFGVDAVIVDSVMAVRRGLQENF